MHKKLRERPNIETDIDSGGKKILLMFIFYSVSGSISGLCVCVFDK